ncbi:four helix bundle protein [bacterium]|nr:four helix bundle protein [bacterium]
MFGFEKLEVWQLATNYAREMYIATRQFPPDERYGLTNQLRRAAVSISANIAEGSRKSSTKDFNRYVEITFGSLMETISHLRIAKDQAFIQESDYLRLYAMAEQLAKMLSGLRNHLKRDTNS